MSATEIIREFWAVILIVTLLLFAGVYFIVFIMKNGVKGLSFVGKEVEEIGIISGGAERPQDRITVYKLTDKQNREVSWCLNITTKSRKFHGVGRNAGEIPLTLNHEEISAILSTFEAHRA